MSQPLYILDTNIWLDWLVFQDNMLDPLKSAHEQGLFKIIYTDEMLAEFADVISRAHFKLAQEQQNRALQRLQQTAHRVETLAKPLIPIRCKDLDDQIFIDMALAYQATWLISKDKHLLSLKNRAAKQNVQVGTITQWLHSQT